MSPVRLSLAAVLTLTLTLAATAAQPGDADKANLGILVDTIRANRKALVAANLKLTDEEAARFWPLYDKYQAELNAVQDRAVKVIQDYTASFQNLSNEQAMKLADEWLSAEGDRVKVRRTYLDEFAKVIPGKKVVRFYQIENKMDAVIRYELASVIPVVEQ
jgi:Spy/CpxP family protein refolding chaperone